MITAGEGKYKVWLKQEPLGGDLIFILGGGDRSHIGAIILKEPNKKSKVIKLEGHYDHIVLEPIAEAASRKYKKTVVVVGGVHIDDASHDEIELIVANCRELLKCI